MLRLRTFGGLSVARSDDGSPSPGATSARRRLALLAAVAANGSRGVPRDRLLAMFWPESEMDRARHALDQTLYQLKRDFGGAALFLGREELSLDPAVITSDVADFRIALERGQRETAVELYVAPFLDGVFVAGADGFERWADEERASLARDHARAVESLANDAATRGEHAVAARWWQRLAILDPGQTRVVVALMRELAASGDRANALRHAEMYHTLARDDLEIEPNPAVAQLADQLRRQPALASPANAAPSPEVSEPEPERAPVPAAASPPGPVAARYVIERELGRGGSATVHLARDLRTQRLVALKVLKPELAAGIAVDRFRHEITVTANLQHPHILPVHDSGEMHGTLYFVMPFVDGESLRDRLAREGPLPVAEGVRLALEIADALAYAHARGIVHRDIKPENILLTSGHAVVADFGLARALEGDAAEPRRTSPGTVVGTLAYLSPEQVTGSDADARSDQYSLAYLLYEMLAGAPPFPGPGLHELMAQRVAGSPAAIRARRPDVPEPLDDAIGRALSPDPARRFADVRAFADAIAASVAASSLALQGTASAVRRRGKRPSRTVRIAGAAAVLVVLLGVLAAWSLRDRPAIERRAWILLADFDNATRDSVFTRALDAVLLTGLQQSDYVSVFPRSRVDQTLARMGRPSGEIQHVRLDESVAREVARREGIHAVVLGAIHEVDSSYAISARVVDAATGDVLAAEHRLVTRRADVIGGVEELVRALRRAIGESADAVARHDVPLPLATTSSLEALRKYADGIAASRAAQRNTALELWREAVAIDSSFALAHAELGAAYYWYNDRPSGDVHFDRALALLDRLTTRERLAIRAAVESHRGSRERAIELRHAILAEYPDDPWAWGQIGYDLIRLDRYTEAIDAYQRQMARDSTQPNNYVNIASAYKLTGDYEAARRSYARAFELQPALLGVNNLNHEYGMLLVVTGRHAEARLVHDSMLAGSTSQRAHGERSLAFLAMYEGKHGEAIDRLRRAVLLADAPGWRLTRARNLLLLSAAEREKRVEAGSGRGEWTDSANAHLDAAHVLFRSTWFEPAFLAYLGKANARAGEVRRAAEVLDSLRSRAKPNNRADRLDQLVLEGEVALARGHADSAAALLSVAHALDTNAFVTESFARALAASGQLAAAARLYERLLATPLLWYGWEAQLYAATAPADLAELYLRMGDTTRAVATWQRLLDRWGTGDSDLQMVLEARRRLAELRPQPEERR